MRSGFGPNGYCMIAIVGVVEKVGGFDGIYPRARDREVV